MFFLDKTGERKSQATCMVPHVYCKADEDNLGSLDLACLPKLRPLTKHMNMCHYHFQDNVRSRKVMTLLSGTKDQTADTLTKALLQNSIVNIAKPCVDSNPRYPREGL